jgi:hypothetical protein
MRLIDRKWLSLLAVALGLGAALDSRPSEADSVSPPRGTLLAAPQRVLTVTVPGLLGELAAITGAAELAPGGLLSCDVAVYHIQYATVGGAGEPTTASAAVMVPVGFESRCRGSRPVLLYAHGTSTDKAFNIADLKGQQHPEGFFMAAFAAQGYVVIAPNFAGYDTSTLPYHPYLVADQQSKDMIDALSAARSALPLAAAPFTRAGARLFVTGYSQGGYVAMATHRALQAAGVAVTASAPMSGPYALTAFADAVFEGRVNGGAVISSVLLVSSYQNSYGDIYLSPGEVFEAQYADGIESLLPTTLLRSDLYGEGKLPMSALFSATPPDPAYADITPAATPADLAPVFALGFGPGNLIKNSYRLSYLLDAQSSPDGSFPVATTAVPPPAPGLALRQALARNDLRNWSPTSPVLLCGGDADPTVFWLNTQAMQSYWSGYAPAAPFSVLDVDSAASAADPYAAIKQDFALAKELTAADAIAHGATDGGATAVAEAYHAALVAPFCLAAVRAFFASQP